MQGSHILLNLRSIGLHDGNSTIGSGSGYSSARRVGDSNPRSEWRTYFTTAIDINEPAQEEAVELKPVEQVLQEAETT